MIVYYGQDTILILITSFILCCVLYFYSRFDCSCNT